MSKNKYSAIYRSIGVAPPQNLCWRVCDGYAPMFIDNELGYVSYRMNPICRRSCKCPQSSDERSIPGSFTALMMAANQEKTPDTFLFTMNSAIAVADAVRGYYETLRQPTPNLCPIRGAGNFRKYKDVLSSEESIDKNIRDKNVVVVDQYVASCGTLYNARNLAFDYGAKAVLSNCETRWYHQGSYKGWEDKAADEETYDADKNPELIQMTSIYKDFMYGMGVLAAKFLSDPENRAWLKPYIENLPSWNLCWTERYSTDEYSDQDELLGLLRD